jgi:hypothetical protein
MLSSLPKLADKNFVIGFIMPLLLGVVGVVALLHDLQPFRGIYASIQSADDFAKLTILALLLWTAAILLMILNHLLYRLLEGYFGPFNRERRRMRMRKTFRCERKRLVATQAIVSDPMVWVSDALKDGYYRDLRVFCATWPTHEEAVLPTRFGNVIRAFETYPEMNYGVESISTWMRLQGVMSKDARVMVDDARAQVDFFVNLWVFALVFSGIAVGRCAYAAWRWANWPDLHLVLPMSWGYGAAAIGGIVVCRLAYEGAVGCAVAWGDLVKTSFDLYLPALAKQLGYKLPPTDAERRDFWDDVASSFLYQTPLKPEAWPVEGGEAPEPKAADDAPGEDDDIDHD